MNVQQLLEDVSVLQEACEVQRRRGSVIFAGWHHERKHSVRSLTLLWYHLSWNLRSLHRSLPRLNGAPYEEPVYYDSTYELAEELGLEGEKLVVATRDWYQALHNLNHALVQLRNELRKVTKIPESVSEAIFYFGQNVDFFKAFAKDLMGVDLED